MQQENQEPGARDPASVPSDEESRARDGHDAAVDATRSGSADPHTGATAHAGDATREPSTGFPLAPAVATANLPGDPDLPNDPTGRARHPGLNTWFLILTIGGLGFALLQQYDASLLVGLAGLFISAQGADLDLAWRRIYHMTSWVTPITGMLLFALLTDRLWHSTLPDAQRHLSAIVSGASAVLCMLTGLRPFSNALILLFFGHEAPSHTLRLAARIVLIALLLGIPAWFFFRIEGPELLQNPQALASARNLGGSLVGNVVLALASVGFLVRRSLRATRERLGVTAFQLRDLWLIPAAVAALDLLDTGAEALQRHAFPALWANDQAFTTALTHGMSPATALLLGVSAGIGEEITLRGALQPRLGIPLTALLFAVLHVQYSWYGIVVIFAIGSLLGVLRRRTSTTVAMTVHGLYDAVTVLLAILAGPQRS